MLITNPKATSTSRRIRGILVRAFAGDLEMRIAETAHRGHASELAQQAADEGYDVVIALGGDGTVNETVNGLLAQGLDDALPALAILPAGSANVFARALGLPGDAIGATRMVLEALRAGRYRRVGLGTADGRYFTFCAGAGLDAEVVHAVEQARGIGAKADPSLYVRTALRQFFTATDRRRGALTLEQPGRAAIDGLFLTFVSNTAPWTYAGRFPVNPSPRAHFLKGLDVFGVRTLDVLPTVTTAAQMLFSRHRPVQGRQVVNVHDASEITLRASRPIAFQLDGDYLGERECVTFRSVPNAIRIVI